MPRLLLLRCKLIHIKANAGNVWYGPATIKRVPRVGENTMVLDNEAIIALGFLVSILVVTGGLLYFVVAKLKR